MENWAAPNSCAGHDRAWCATVGQAPGGAMAAAGELQVDAMAGWDLANRLSADSLGWPEQEVCGGAAAARPWADPDADTCRASPP